MVSICLFKKKNTGVAILTSDKTDFIFLLILYYFRLCWVFVAADFSLVAASGGCSLAWCAGCSSWWLLLLQGTVSRPWASVFAAPGLQSTLSAAVVHRLSCSTTCGIFSDQGSNPFLLHWQDSLPGKAPPSVFLTLTIPGTLLIFQWRVPIFKANIGKRATESSNLGKI